MKYVTIALFVVGLVLAAYLALRPAPERSYLEIEQERLAVEQARALAPIWTLAQSIIIVGGSVLLVAIPAALGVAALARFRRNQRLIKPDAAGRVPVVLSDAATYQAAALAALSNFHATEHARASIAPVPHTYSPHFTYSPRSETNGAGMPQLPVSDADLAAPTLPDAVPLADYISQIKAHCLGFGVDTSGRLLQAPLSQSYHLLASGRTRSGKSNSLNLILTQLHHQNRHHHLACTIAVLDYKRELSNIWRRSRLVELSTYDPGDMVDLLKAAVHGADGLLARQEQFARVGQERGRVIGNLVEYERITGDTLTRHYICIDELNAVLVAADNKKLSDELAKLLYLGAGAGFYIVGGAHQLDASTFKRAAKEQFSSRLQFGPFDQSATNLMYGSIRIEETDQQLLDGRSGRGLIQLVSQSRPTPFQALQVEEADILPFIDMQPSDAEAATMRQLADDAATINTQPFGSNAPISDATRRAIWTKKQRGLNKEETILHLWSIPKNGRDRYREAAALYDRVIAEGPPQE